MCFLTGRNVYILLSWLLEYISRVVRLLTFACSISIDVHVDVD